MKKNKNREFNLVIIGVGGQGQITLLKILAEAAVIEGYDLRTSELHGLSQRGGSVEAHIRFGKPRSRKNLSLRGGEIFSPLIGQAGADFILALETQEALRVLYYANSQTQFLINKYFLAIPGQNLISEKEILNQIKKFTPSKKIELIAANEICKKELGNGVLAGVYLLGLAINKNLIPLNPLSLSKAIKKTIPEKYLELNLKALELAQKA